MNRGLISEEEVEHLVKNSLEKGIQLKIDSSPDREPEDVKNESLTEFNRWFNGVYKIDNIRINKDHVDIVIKKDRDGGLYEGEVVNA